jgi:simple sugar transport system ATP-binding protein
MASGAASAERLEMRGITRRFGDLVALNDVTFTARAGEIHALLGENGAGKSTLMQILAGLYRIQEGEIRLDGRPVRIDSPRDAAAHGIAMVHQHFTLVEPFTVAENLALAADARRPAPGAKRRSFDPRQAAAPAFAMAERLGWSLAPDARVGSLPVGVQQRVEILKALQGEARLLIFDEPTAVLAPGEVEELFRLLRRLRGEGRTLIFISHKLNEVTALCDRVTVLRRGHRIATLPVSETDARGLAVLMVGEEASGRPPSPPTGYPRAEPGTRPSGARGGCGGGGVSAPPIIGGPGGPAAGGLTLNDLTVAGPGRPAVDHLSVSVARGEILGLAGVDGNGQVELAEALWGIRPVAAGSISLDGEALTPSASMRRRMGWIPQDRHRTGLVLGMSVRENLILAAHAWPSYRRGPFLRLGALRGLADRLVREFDIRVADPRQPAASLSGGNQQKIVIARALFHEPDLLIAVNPTRGLDIGATGYVHAQLRRARARGAAILLISTELDEVLALSDRVGVLYEGRLMDILPPDAPRQTLGLLMGGRSGASA